MNDNNDSLASSKGKEELSDDNLSGSGDFVDPIHALLMGQGGPVAGQQRSDEGTEQRSARGLLGLLQQALLAGGGSGGGAADAASRDLRGGPVDGEHSTTPGPAPCGKKHFYEGREVDFVTKCKGKALGFNVDDNPLLVAQKFVAKHRFNPESTDNTALVTQIAELIRETVKPAAKYDDNMDLGHLIEEGARSGNPYADEPVPTVIRPHGEAGGVKAVYNHHTKQVDVFHYHSDADAELVKRREEEAKKRAVATQQKDEQKRRKELEREEVLRMVQMRREDRPVQQSYVPQPKSGAAGLTGGMATLGQLSSSGGGGGGGGRLGGGAVGRASSHKPRPKMEWDNGYALERYRKSTPEQFEQELNEAGFTEEEKDLVVFKMKAMQLMQQPGAGLMGADGAEARVAGEKRPARGYWAEPDDDDEGASELTGAGRMVARRAFEGTGHSLVPASPAVPPSDEAATPAGGTETSVEMDDTPVVVDASLPCTQLRIAVPGRPPLTVTFNVTHTVLDIRRHLNRTSPVDRPYSLHILRPARRLDNLAETIEEAGLQKGSVTVMFNTTT